MSTAEEPFTTALVTDPLGGRDDDARRAFTGPVDFGVYEPLVIGRCARAYLAGVADGQRNARREHTRLLAGWTTGAGSVRVWETPDRTLRVEQNEPGQWRVLWLMIERASIDRVITYLRDRDFDPATLKEI